mmetsp:Transcript_35462/g.89335  ORF Transcript_35462/g.89335 Transcript_35462/m.89335 type:complete len:344 (+) Transcript_35462:872-1903(+)
MVVSGCCLPNFSVRKVCTMRSCSIACRTMDPPACSGLVLEEEFGDEGASMSTRVSQCTACACMAAKVKGCASWSLSVSPCTALRCKSSASARSSVEAKLGGASDKCFAKLLTVYKVLTLSGPTVCSRPLIAWRKSSRASAKALADSGVCWLRSTARFEALWSESAWTAPSRLTRRLRQSLWRVSASSFLPAFCNVTASWFTQPKVSRWLAPLDVLSSVNSSRKQTSASETFPDSLSIRARFPLSLCESFNNFTFSGSSRRDGKPISCCIFTRRPRAVSMSHCRSRVCTSSLSLVKPMVRLISLWIICWSTLWKASLLETSKLLSTVCTFSKEFTKVSLKFFIS